MTRTSWRVFAAFAVLAGQAHAVDYRTEYGKKVSAAQNVGALGDNLGGDQVNFYTGGTEFSTTDVSVPGNFALPFSIGRRFVVEPSRTYGSPSKGYNVPMPRAFGDWDLDIPQMSGTFAKVNGWEIDSTTPQMRCSVGSQLKADGSPAAGTPRSNALPWWQFWNGNTLHIPGEGDQTLLVPLQTNTLRPSAGGPYHWTTNKHWWISCLTQTKNGVPGEGFLATSPSGTKYYFDWVTERVASVATYERPDGSGDVVQIRKEVLILPSKIVDRFGNWVAFTYTTDAFAKLQSISASDGRLITLAYDATTGRVNSVTDGTRTWSYEYVSGLLRNVILPDASKWQYFFSGFNTDMVVSDSGCVSQGQPPYNCYASDEMTLASAASGYLIHPSGARVDYAFQANFQPAFTPRWVMGLTDKSVSGPGMATATWRYAFSPNIPDAKAQCIAGACPTRVWTDVLGPNGAVTRTMFNTDGQQLQSLDGEQVATGNSSPAIPHSLRGADVDVADDVSPLTSTVPAFYREADTFYTAAPTKVGTNPFYLYAVGFSEYLYPVQKSVQYLQGASFTRQINSFDAYANPLSATSTGTNLGLPAWTYSRTDTTTYFHDTARWIVGQVATTNCTGTAECTATPIAQTDYDSNSLPWKNYVDGLLQSTTTYDFTHADALGAVGSVTDGRGNAVLLGQWYRGVPKTITLPAAPAVTTMTADVASTGQINWVVDQSGAQTCYQYDLFGRLTSIYYPSETAQPTSVAAAPCDMAGTDWSRLQRSFASNPNADYGLPANLWKETVTVGNGRTSTYYDARWRPVIKLTEDLGNTATRSFVVTRYDANGRPVFVSYPVGSLGTVNDALTGVRTSYDALGRVTKVQQDNGATPGLAVLDTTTAYLAGFRTQETNPRGFATTSSYQVYDAPSTDLPRLIELPEGVTTSISRQLSLGKPLAVSRSGTYAGSPLSLARNYIYDANQRLCLTTNPESGGTIVDYDAAGNLAWSADGLPLATCDRITGAAASSKLAFAYDALNRPIARTTAGGVANLETTYAPDGKVLQLVAHHPTVDTVTSTYSWDHRRLLTRETVKVNANAPWGFDYAYNVNGHISSQTYPGSVLVGYAPDALGRPTQVGTFASSVTYYPSGAISGFSYGNGIVHAMTQNARQLPARSLDANGATKILDDNYVYDPNGNVLSLTDASAAPTIDNRTWGVLATTTYDGLNRLLSVRSSNQWGTATYTYDPLDNLMSSRLVASVSSGYDYTYNRTSNLLTSLARVGGGTYAYTTNPSGDITNDGRQAYQFDAVHRMSAVTTKESYLYDGNGRRARTLNSTTGTIEYFGYGADGRLLQDWSNRRNVRNAYIYLGNTLVGLYEVTLSTGATASKYKHTDALGSPVVTTDLNRAVLGRSAYTPYGVPVAPMDGVGYTGHFIDVGTGLTYMQQRYYDPSIGRFLSTDPARSEANLFSYAKNNPLLLSDPDGRVAKAESREQASAVESEINKHTSVEYKFDDDLKLQRTSTPTESEHTSQLYEKALDVVIASDKTATFDIAKERRLDVGGGMTTNQDVDACCGGGETVRVGTNGDVRVTVSPTSQDAYTDTMGRRLPYGPADVMLHEIMVHVVPTMSGATVSQPVLPIENAARVQAGLRPRGSGEHSTLVP